ncbi:MAG: 16S rRNA (cytosine(967)-C(5))-methyltransferase RsmB [Deltaproteobacteria bacterium]|nr:16S rRNA (cytosine(967)-C(5))-methyltransferase RsmB [Deltaproteobacteria bacterium]
MARKSVARIKSAPRVLLRRRGLQPDPSRPGAKPARPEPERASAPETRLSPAVPEPTARSVALEVLERVERDAAFSDLALDAALDRSGMEERDRALATQLVYGVLRWQGALDYALGTVCHEPLERTAPEVRRLLRLGAYQLLFLDRVPAAAAVNEAVKLARRAHPVWVVSFVNAVLRRVARHGHSLLVPAPDLDPTARLTIEGSHPAWLVRRWVEEWGIDETRALCLANNAIPPITIRCNRLRVTREDLRAALAGEGVTASPTTFSPEGLIVTGGPPPMRTTAFQKGWLHVQDEASQLVAYLVDPQPGEQVLDVCAAPGGKTTHMAQLMADQGSLVALDSHPGRLQALEETCRRLGVTNVQTVKQDATEPFALPAGAGFDRALVDPPCSGLGVLRRNPEAKWRLTPEVPGELQPLQEAILEQAAGWVRRGGLLVYSTCTLAREENEEVIAHFLARHPEYRVEDFRKTRLPSFHLLLDAAGRFRTFPHRHGMDGFFAVGLRRQRS